MDLELKGKVALITGARKGIGLAAAKAFAAEGAKTLVADIDEALSNSVAEELRSQGHEAIAIRCDVSVEADVKNMVEQTIAQFGRLDAAFNNIGVQSPAIEIVNADGEEFDRDIAINMKGVRIRRGGCDSGTSGTRSVFPARRGSRRSILLCAMRSTSARIFRWCESVAAVIPCFARISPQNSSLCLAICM